LTALVAMFLQQTFAPVGKVLPAVIAPLVLSELDADPGGGRRRERIINKLRGINTPSAPTLNSDIPAGLQDDQLLLGLIADTIYVSAPRRQEGLLTA
jgi:hypothetical protein